MEQADDISILITDKEFQKILSGWGDLNEEQKTEVYIKYILTESDVITLQQLWYSLDFKTFEQEKSVVEAALDDTIWQLAERDHTLKILSPVQKFYQYFSRIAAVLIVPILIYTAYIQFSNSNNAASKIAPQLVTVTSQAGTVTKLALPDGSKVYLNAGSTLSYPTEFDKQSRKITLEGEGYFEVVKNKQVPMIISAGNMNLKVYGTSFNVNARQVEDFVKVTLIEGSVSLSAPEGKIDGKNELFITPGQTVTCEKKTKDIVLQNDDTFLYTAWKDGIMIFRNKTFESVLRQLSEKFNVDISLEDKSLASIPMDATFRDENINEILRLLSLSTPFKFYYGNSPKLNDGTFAKSKIYIEKK